MAKRKWYKGSLLLLALFAAGVAYGQGNSGKKSTDNTLNEKEKKEGWKLLFNGQNTQGWRGAYKTSFPDSGWAVEGGTLCVLSSGGRESRNGGDIVTEEEYENFELTADFK